MERQRLCAALATTLLVGAIGALGGCIEVDRSTPPAGDIGIDANADGGHGASNDNGGAFAPDTLKTWLKNAA